MRGITRRTVLGLLGTTATAGLAGTAVADTEVERVLSTGDPVPENIGFDADGNLYVGITGGEVRRLPADRTDETGLGLDATEQIATYPGGVFGVTVADGTVYTAVNGETGSVFEAEATVSGESSELATLLPDGNGFVNDVYVDGDRLLATESFGGVIYEVGRDGSGGSVWVDDDLLDTADFGANGITRIGDDVYVAVSFASDDDGNTVGRIVRVPVEDDGSAGTPVTFVESPALTGIDGVTARGPQLYGALNVQDRIAKIAPDGERETVVEGAPLAFPSEIVFDPTSPGKAFICNFTRSAPEQAGVLRTEA